jgi:raffinose/stachyose/melibiose transport system permease protein
MSKQNKLSKKIIKNLISVFLIIIYFAPFYIIISLSFKNVTNRSSYWSFPINDMNYSSYIYALIDGKVALAIRNTLIVTVISVLLIILIGSFASYPLARVKTKMNKFLLSVFVGVMVVPPLSVLVPIYKEMAILGGINTFWGIIVLTVTYGLPLAVFMFTNFIIAIPEELDEAALLDGCSQFEIFPRIILPNMAPITASIAILSGVSIWNDYSFQLYILQKPALRTMTLAISSFFNDGLINLPAAGAASVIAVLPLIVIYLFLQKYFVQGSMDSAIK